MGQDAWSTGEHLWNKLPQSPSFPPLGIQAPSEASQKEKKRVKILLHEAGNGARMLKVIPLVPLEYPFHGILQHDNGGPKLKSLALYLFNFTFLSKNKY